MSLADLIKKRKSMPASEAKTIARDVAKGLEYLHCQVQKREGEEEGRGARRWRGAGERGRGRQRRD